VGKCRLQSSKYQGEGKRGNRRETFRSDLVTSIFTTVCVHAGVLCACVLVQIFKRALLFKIEISTEETSVLKKENSWLTEMSRLLPNSHGPSPGLHTHILEQIVAKEKGEIK
jgi:hypothetical protein